MIDSNTYSMKSNNPVYSLKFNFSNPSKKLSQTVSHDTLKIGDCN